MPEIDVARLWPAWLLLALPLMFWATWRRGSGGGRTGIAVTAVLRSLALVSAVAALTDMTISLESRSVSIVYALDVSRSIDPSFTAEALRWIASADARTSGTHSGYVAFANEARLVGSRDELAGIAAEAAASALDRGGTDIEAAVAVARHGFAPDPCRRLVLITDGNATRGDTWRAVERMRSDGVQAYAVPAAPTTTVDAWLLAVEVPDGTRAMEPAAVVVKAHSRTAANGTIEVRVPGAAPASRQVELQPGENRWSFAARFTHAGPQEVQVRLAIPGDAVPENDSIALAVWIAAQPKILLIEDAPGSGRFLAQALRRQGIVVTTARVGEPALTADRLRGHDAIILNEPGSSSLDPGFLRKVELYVKNGGGLAYVAGDNAHGSHGLRNSLLETVLPIVFEGSAERQNVDLVLLIDRSFSMRGLKLESAKTAAFEVLDRLAPHHRLAVVAFDAVPHDEVPLAPVSDRRVAGELIAGIAASGQTNVFNALLHAHALLRDSKAPTRHVVLLSDGHTAPAGRRAPLPGDAEADVDSPPGDGPRPDSFREIAAAFERAGITLSTVAMGEEPDLALLANLAQWTHGRSRVAATPEEIPALFVDETRKLTAESLVEEPFRPTLTLGVESLAGIDFGQAPLLRGFAVARPKRHAEVLLSATNQRPLLVRHHYGLGQVVAFMSDSGTRWADAWPEWPGYGRFWAQTVRDLLRRDGETLSFQAVREGGIAHISLDAVDTAGLARGGLEPQIRMLAPDGTRHDMALAQTGPGRYAARIPVQPSARAPYSFALTRAAGIPDAELERVGTRTLFHPMSDEYLAAHANESLLRTMSEITGGQFMPGIEDIHAPCNRAGRDDLALAPLFTALTLAFFLADIAARRLPRRQRGR